MFGHNVSWQHKRDRQTALQIHWNKSTAFSICFTFCLFVFSEIFAHKLSRSVTQTTVPLFRTKKWKRKSCTLCTVKHNTQHTERHRFRNWQNGMCNKTSSNARKEMSLSRFQARTDSRIIIINMLIRCFIFLFFFRLCWILFFDKPNSKWAKQHSLAYAAQCVYSTPTPIYI